MTFNEALKDKIYSTIMSVEETSELDKYRNERRALVFARELLCVARKREERRKLFVPEVIGELQKDLPYVEDITLDYARIGKTLTLNLWLKEQDENTFLNKKMILMEYSDGITKPCIEYGLSERAKEAIKSNQDLFREIANFGLDNHYNERTSFNTKSQVFSIDMRGSYFFIHLATSLFKGEFYLTEDFMRDVRRPDRYNRNNIVTSDGSFELNTNIWGVKKLFLRPSRDLVKNYYHGEKDPTLRFLNHLQVYQSDLTPYLKKEVQRIRRR